MVLETVPGKICEGVGYSKMSLGRAQKSRSNLVAGMETKIHLKTPNMNSFCVSERYFCLCKEWGNFGNSPPVAAPTTLKYSSTLGEHICVTWGTAVEGGTCAPWAESCPYSAVDIILLRSFSLTSMEFTRH